MRQAEDVEHRSELQRPLGAFDGSKESRLRFAIRKPPPREIHVECLEESKEDADDGTELLDPPS
ncbi:MAG: hypothetical protein HKN62_04725 [Phycisphaerales bacterium]|nr:hypothetical protein [Phycisphaerales bacterium]